MKREYVVIPKEDIDKLEEARLLLHKLNNSIPQTIEFMPVSQTMYRIVYKKYNRIIGDIMVIKEKYRVGIIQEDGHSDGKNFTTQLQAENWVLSMMETVGVKKYRIINKETGEVVDRS